MTARGTDGARGSAPAYLVFDYGTTALKTVLYDETLAELGTASREWTYSYPGRRMVECDAEQYVDAAVSSANELLDRFGGRGSLRAVTVTGQAETIVTVGRDGKPLGNAIVWLDGRADAELSALAPLTSENYLYKITGNTGFDPIMPLFKLPWMRANEPERWRAADKFLLIKEYIVLAMTGRCVGEWSAQSCSGYFDITRCRYDDALLSLAGIPSDRLPELCPSDCIVGPLSREFSAATGITSGAVVVNGMLDQCAASVGAGGVREGVVSETTGTVLAVASPMNRFEPDSSRERVLMFRHGVPGMYLALPNCPTAGAVLKWCRDEVVREDFASIDAELIRRAARGRVGSGLTLLPHFAGYLSPVNDPDACGVIYGLTLDRDRYDVAHAAMEGVAYLLRENLELLERSGVRTDEIISLGGGAKSDFWLQIKADVCGKRFVTLGVGEATAFGAATGAACATGELSFGDVPALVRREKSFEPGDNSAHYESAYALYLELNRRLGFGCAR